MQQQLLRVDIIYDLEIRCGHCRIFEIDLRISLEEKIWVSSIEICLTLVGDIRIYEELIRIFYRPFGYQAVGIKFEILLVTDRLLSTPDIIEYDLLIRAVRPC
jgi:hypothetical protein